MPNSVPIRLKRSLFVVNPRASIQPKPHLSNIFLTFNTSHHTLRPLLEILLTRKIVLVIRLTRTGKTSQESFRIVVAEQKKAVKREYLELLGHYLPTRNPKVFEYNKERILYWISKGAQPSETVASLLKAQGVQEMDKYIYFKTDRKSKSKKAGAEEPAMPAATASSSKVVAPTETPAA